MWCLETIIALNEAAALRAKNGEPISMAYRDVGIDSSKEEDKPKEDDKRIRVAS